jgi:hypothetical protein
VTPLGRKDYTHLHGLFFCLRMGIEEECRLAKRLSVIAVEMPTHLHPTFRDLRIHGAPAVINEDSRFWSTILLFCSNRNPPDASWDPAGTIEFTLTLPARLLRQKAAQRVQAAFRGHQARSSVFKQIIAETTAT